MHTSDTLQVLMSTYNGAKYISAQLDSILSQPYEPIHILIRDDGSSDETISIIEKYQTQYPHRIELIKGDNIGVIPSFWSLLQHADRRATYFSFCDQDDVWMTHKAATSVRLLQNLEKEKLESKQVLAFEENNNRFLPSFIPAMICTDTQLTDGELNPTVVWPGMPHLKPSFYNALIQNIAVGATVSFNAAALALLMDTKQKVNISAIQMHDWWVYLVISCFGNIHFEHHPTIYYRQHGGNAVGGEANVYQKIKKKWNSFLKHRGDKKLLVQQAKEFYRVYGSKITDVQMKDQLERFITPRTTFVARIRYLRTCKLFRQSITEQLLFRILILVGYI
ncbi:glycosyltransferase family 2 protein [Paenibacillus hunanensis]|uniref:glycosyltransferase family 2 protein n=1 Tax=Paenibacillus hunanensis TaxID=539262 RepID=UPI00202712A8|nr:glycosyltransferase family 2 protein [Paenibacillus hunanensis]MCL9662840.1 glycosyltransferase family 2 protein [Paenibacillus hunanensis]